MLTHAKITYGDYLLMVHGVSSVRAGDGFSAILTFRIVESRAVTVTRGDSILKVEPNAVGSLCSESIDFFGRKEKVARPRMEAFVRSLFGPDLSASGPSIVATYEEMLQGKANGMYVRCVARPRKASSGYWYTNCEWGCVDPFGTGENTVEKLTQRASAGSSPPADSAPIVADPFVGWSLYPDGNKASDGSPLRYKAMSELQILASRSGVNTDLGPLGRWVFGEHTSESPVERLMFFAFLGLATSSSGSFEWADGKITICGVGWRVVPQFEALNYRLDFALLSGDKKIDVEVDGHDTHGTKEQTEKDKKRERDLQDNGWLIRRYTGTEVFRSAAACVADVIRFAVGDQK